MMRKDCCKHWQGAIVQGDTTCKAGVEWRVGIPARFRPCLPMFERKPHPQRLPCERRELPTDAEVVAYETEVERWETMILDEHKCPHEGCGVDLEETKDTHHDYLHCPEHGLMMRAHKRRR